MTSAENSVSELPNLKIFWGRIPPDPPTRLMPSALARVPPLYKKTSYSPAVCTLHYHIAATHQGPTLFLLGMYAW